MSSTARTILFWVMMVALAVVLWKMSSNRQGQTNTPSSSMSYSDFMTQVDNNNVASIRLVESPSTTSAEGQLRQPQDRFRTTIPNETIPALTEQLRKQGASIEVSEGQTTTWPRLIVNVLPLLVILALWVFITIYQARRRSAQNRPPDTGTPTIPTNRPIG